jgi:hypothetical protein
VGPCDVKQELRRHAFQRASNVDPKWSDRLLNPKDANGAAGTVSDRTFSDWRCIS